MSFWFGGVLFCLWGFLLLFISLFPLCGGFFFFLFIQPLVALSLTYSKNILETSQTNSLVFVGPHVLY